MRPRLKQRFDPPLRQRLLWRDQLSAATLISEDRGLMARTYGSLALAGAMLGLLTLAIHANPDRNYELVAVVAGIELVLGAVCFTVYRALPTWFFHFGIVLGIVLICVSGLGESRDSVPLLSLCLVFIVLVANLFFGARAALSYTILAAVSFGFVLYLKEVPYWSNYAVASLVILGSAGAVVGWLRRRLERVAEQLDREAKTDAVTGLANRRGFTQRCDLEIARAARGETSISLIVCDLDRFKRVNDELGHDRGDEALCTAATAIRDSVRAIDAVGRLGGEEFGIVLPGASRKEAMAVAVRVKVSIRQAFEGHPVPVTVSSGVATQSGANGSRELLLSEADGAMYEAKRQGRDRAVAADAAPREVEGIEVRAPRYSLAASSTK